MAHYHRVLIFFVGFPLWIVIPCTCMQNCLHRSALPQGNLALCSSVKSVSSWFLWFLWEFASSAKLNSSHLDPKVYSKPISWHPWLTLKVNLVSTNSSSIQFLSQQFSLHPQRNRWSGFSSTRSTSGSNVSYLRVLNVVDRLHNWYRYLLRQWFSFPSLTCCYELLMFAAEFCLLRVIIVKYPKSSDFHGSMGF